jgi:hypothetical protein
VRKRGADHGAEDQQAAEERSRGGLFPEEQHGEEDAVHRFQACDHAGGLGADLPEACDKEPLGQRGEYQTEDDKQERCPAIE